MCVDVYVYLRAGWTLTVLCLSGAAYNASVTPQASSVSAGVNDRAKPQTQPV